MHYTTFTKCEWNNSTRKSHHRQHRGRGGDGGRQKLYTATAQNSNKIVCLSLSIAILLGPSNRMANRARSNITCIVPLLIRRKLGERVWMLYGWNGRRRTGTRWASTHFFFVWKRRRKNGNLNVYSWAEVQNGGCTANIYCKSCLREKNRVPREVWNGRAGIMRCLWLIFACRLCVEVTWVCLYALLWFLFCLVPSPLCSAYFAPLCVCVCVGLCEQK